MNTNTQEICERWFVGGFLIWKFLKKDIDNLNKLWYNMKYNEKYVPLV